MILLMSSFITHDREVNRHNRLDILMMTLKSYSILTWSQVHLYLKLDEEFLPFRDELKHYIETIFDGVKLHIVWNRIETQDEWKPIIRKITKSQESIWFTQNDDHPFVDINTEIISEGERLLNQHKGEFASIYLSHWPEILKLSGKNDVPFRQGSFIGFKATLLDSIQIFTPALLRYIFIDLDWGDRRYRRIDTLLRQRKIWGKSGNTDLELQTIYVPLREQCRKFMAYSHVEMYSVLPLKPTFELAKVQRKPADVKNLMLARHKSLWTRRNQFRIPRSWVIESQKLYGE